MTTPRIDHLGALTQQQASRRPEVREEKSPAEGNALVAALEAEVARMTEQMLSDDAAKDLDGCILTAIQHAAIKGARRQVEVLKEALKEPEIANVHSQA